MVDNAYHQAQKVKDSEEKKRESDKALESSSLKLKECDVLINTKDAMIESQVYSMFHSTWC